MAASSSRPPEIDLSFLLNQAAYALAAHMGAALAELDISVREYCVLWKAADRERTQIEIAELSGLDKTTMVVTLDALEQSGLATRKVSDTDRRARVVAVTAAGRAVLARAHRRIGRVYDHALSDLDPDDRAAFVAALQTVTGGVLASPAHTAPQRRREVKAQVPA